MHLNLNQAALQMAYTSLDPFPERNYYPGLRPVGLSLPVKGSNLSFLVQSQASCQLDEQASLRAYDGT